jgi:hypothetical protein
MSRDRLSLVIVVVACSSHLLRYCFASQLMCHAFQMCILARWGGPLQLVNDDCAVAAQQAVVATYDMASGGLTRPAACMHARPLYHKLQPVMNSASDILRLLSAPGYNWICLT